MEELENNEKGNPNNIGEITGFNAGEVETFSNRVYRSVTGREAINDLVKSGEVRSKQAAGLVEDARRGDTVLLE